MSQHPTLPALGFTLFDVATAAVRVLGHDWEAAPVGLWQTSGTISHRDGHHDGFTLSTNTLGELLIKSITTGVPSLVRDVAPEQGLDYVAALVAATIRESLAQRMFTSDEPLPFETLIAIYRDVERLMQEHVERVLPRHVQGAVLDVLDEEALAKHGAPRSVVFETTEQDDGYVWLADEVTVEFSDGIHDVMELGHYNICRTFLADHALAHEVGDHSVLTVTFDPPALALS
ncbi:hypothetical protein ACFCWY_08670 [Streptomyces sp. NPDC056362]|uniref:hypothetical protein n=1 Tax=unclassified Streptomyces TaxID=2593676 RepID=UPI0035D88DEA